MLEFNIYRIRLFSFVFPSETRRKNKYRTGHNYDWWTFFALVQYEAQVHASMGENLFVTLIMNVTEWVIFSY